MKKYDIEVPMDYEYREYLDRLFDISLTWLGRYDSIPDRNDRGEIEFIKWDIDWKSVVVEEILDDGETKEITDKELIGDIVDKLPEPEELD